MKYTFQLCELRIKKKEVLYSNTPKDVCGEATAATKRPLAIHSHVKSVMQKSVHLILIGR